MNREFAVWLYRGEHNPINQTAQRLFGFQHSVWLLKSGDQVADLLTVGLGHLGVNADR
ncbi:hypothetical protein [Thioclava sp.]|uniref:hypothetical protein n=1 Tax=Thioclava sp. TaxID=1933450 RepID=UPI003AA826DF